jgi:hypothetical protein
MVGVPAEVRKLTFQIPVRIVAASATLTLVPQPFYLTANFHVSRAQCIFFFFTVSNAEIISHSVLLIT